MGSDLFLYSLPLINLQLQQALGVAEQDVKDASAGVLKELRRFQKEKEDDLKRYMVAAIRFRLVLPQRLLTCAVLDCLRQMPY